MINYLLFNEGFIHPYLIFFGEKALLVLKGTPPRLENIGFIYPPLPVFAAGLFQGNALMAQSFISSLISAYIIVELIRVMRSFRAAFPLIVYMIFSLPILFLSTQRFDLYLYFFLIILSMKFLYQYVKNEYSLYLFLSAPLFGITFFTHFSSIYLIPMFFIIIFFLYKMNLKKFLAVSLVFITPYLIFMGIFSYINWVFTSEAFGFLRAYRLMFSNQSMDAIISAGSIIGSLIFMMKYILHLLPVLAPCLIGIYYDRKLVSIVPFMIIFSFVYSNLFFPAVYASAIFIIHFLVMTEFSVMVRKRLFWAAMIVSLISSPLYAITSKELFEKDFTAALFGRFERNIEIYKKVANMLQDKEGKILLDDGSTYHIVYLVGRPDKFILPYQYEFTPALSNPGLYVNYVVAVKNRNSDLIFQHFEGGIKGFYPIFDDEKIIIWEKT